MSTTASFRCLVLFLTSASAALGSVPTVVSPGGPDEPLPVEVRCPTFSWGLVGGAESYELEVRPAGTFRADTKVDASSAPAIAMVLPGSVGSWTPPMGRCLDEGVAYGWRIRALDPLGSTGEWSRALLFLPGSTVANASGDDAGDEEQRRPRLAPRSSFDAAPAGSIPHLPSSSSGSAVMIVPPSMLLDTSQIEASIKTLTLPTVFSKVSGVVGGATASSGTSYGVIGQGFAFDDSSTRIGVYGEATFGQPLTGFGVVGVSEVGVQGSGGTGVRGLGTGYGGIFIGEGTGDGLLVRRASSAAADILLGGSNDSDDGMIRLDPFHTQGDIYFDTNDAFVIRLDVDANTAVSELQVRDENNVTVFEVEDSGNVLVNGSLVHNSDVSAKDLQNRVDTDETLRRLSALPLWEWSWKRGSDGTHMGPTAQDFHAAFGLGGGTTSVATVDLDGVSLAAIQALHRLVQDQQREIANLRAEIERISNVP